MPAQSTCSLQEQELAGIAQAGWAALVRESLGTACLRELQEIISSAAKITGGNMDCCHAQLQLFPFLVKDDLSGSGRSEDKVSPCLCRRVGCIL